MEDGWEILGAVAVLENAASLGANKHLRCGAECRKICEMDGKTVSDDDAGNDKKNPIQERHIKGMCQRRSAATAAR